MFVLIFAFKHEPLADSIISLLQVPSNFIDLKPFTGNETDTAAETTDPQFIASVDSSLNRCKSIEAAYDTLKKLLPVATEKKVTAELFISFLRSRAVGVLLLDTVAYQWYCKKWRDDALAAKDDFIRMCYSDCFYEKGRSRPLGSPIIDTSSLGQTDSIRIGLFLRDRKSKVEYTYKLSHLKWAFPRQKPSFETIEKKTLLADSANWNTHIKIEEGGVYRLIIYTQDNYRAFYFRTGSLMGLAHCDNQKILVQGYSTSKKFQPPYSIYLFNGTSFIRSTTDSSGFCAFTFRDFPDSQIKVQAWIEKNGFVVPIEIEHTVFDERYKTGSYVYCDRTWYKPGDTVHIGGLVKNFTSEARFSNADIDSVSIKIESSVTGNIITKTVPLDKMGHFFDSLAIPSDAHLEPYKVSVSIPSNNLNEISKKTETEFEIALFKKPSCKILVSADKSTYSPHDTIKGNVKAFYFFGVPVRYGSMSLSAVNHRYKLDTLIRDPLHTCYHYCLTDSGQPIDLSSVDKKTLDKNGELSFSLPVDSVADNGYVTFQAIVQGQDKRYYDGLKKIFVAVDTPFINVFHQLRNYGTTRDLFISCFVTDPYGYPCKDRIVECTLERSDTVSGYVKTVETNKLGVARFRFQGIPNNKPYQAVCKLNPGRPDMKQVRFDIESQYADFDQEQHIITDRDFYKQGDTVYATVNFPYDSSIVLFTAGTTDTRYYRCSFSTGPLRFAIPVSSWTGPILFLTAACYSGDDESPVIEHKEVAISPDSSLLMNVSISSSRNVKPGDSCSLSLRVTDRNGKSAKASFSAAIVDEAVFALRPEKDSGMLNLLVPRSYSYPCSAFSTINLDTRENLRYLENIRNSTFLSNGYAKKVNMNLKFGGDQSSLTEDLRSLNDFRLFHCMENGGHCASAIGYGSGYGDGFGGSGSGGIDDLIGNLMGEDGSGELDLIKGSALVDRPVEVRQNFRDQACWIPSIVTNNSGKASINFRLPDDLTQWRIRLRGSDGGSYLIDFRDSLIANKPLAIKLETPRFFTAGDISVVHSVIFNNTGRQVKATVKLQISGGVKPNSDTVKQIDLNSDDIAVVEWPLTVSGTDSISLTATVQSAEFSDGEKRTVPVIMYALKKRTGTTAFVHDSCAITIDMPFEAMSSSAKLTLHAASNEITALLPSLKYLMEFPHGCVEQTMSRFLPDLYVAHILAANGIKNQEMNKVFNKYAAEGLKLLRNYQHVDGGWGWWVDDDTDRRMTALVVKGLYLALNTPINDTFRKQIKEMLSRGEPRLSAMIDSCKGDPVSLLPLLTSLIYSPILEQHKNLIQTIASDPSKLTILQCADLLECTHNLKLFAEDSLLISYLEIKAQRSDEMVWWVDTTESEKPWEKSSEFLTARVLTGIACAKPDHRDIPPALSWLFTKQDGVKWVCTATTAEVIRAISTCFLKSPGSPGSKTNTICVKINGSQFPLPVISGIEKIGLANVLTVTDSLLRNRNLLSFANKGRKPAFCFASLDYSTRVPSQPDTETPIRILRSYSRIDDMQMMGESKQPMDGQCSSGDQIEVKISLTTKKQSRYVMIEDPIPAGMEIIEPENGSKPEGVTHCEYYPDKVVFYLSSLPDSTVNLTYRLRAIFPGTYRVLPTHAESMYVPEIVGNSCGDEVKIVK